MQTIKTENLTWVDVKAPSKEDVKWLGEKFFLHPLVQKEILPPLDYPKIENFDDYFFIVLFYPFFDKETCQNIPFEIDIIVSKNYIITFHDKDIVPLRKIFIKCNLYKNIRDKIFKEDTGLLLYSIIQEILDACFPKMKHIKQNIEEIEKTIYQKESKKYKKTAMQIALVKRDIIGLQQIIELQKMVLQELAKESKKMFSQNLIPYFNRLINTHNYINSILNVHRKTFSALNSTNQSILTNRTNEIVKILTMASIIVLPLSVVASILGMNTKYLPIVGLKGDFWIVLAIMATGILGLIGFFKAKKWI
ncbi:magnesium transporter CorA family protein [Patescibacteria group bacterium]|nr:magnesium transporter CorA family protein [Patescibacteria group bacterium]